MLYFIEVTGNMKRSADELPSFPAIKQFQPA